VYYVVDPCASSCQACNSVTISSTSVDPNPGNNMATDCDEVLTRADLSVTKTDGVTSVVAGKDTVYTYTITTCNAGPSCAQHVTLVDHFPVEVTQLPGSIVIVNSTGTSLGSCISAVDSQDFSCTVLTLVPGACVTVQVQYRVPATAVTCSVYNVATVSSVTFDPNLCNNVASDRNALVEEATLSITKTAPGYESVQLSDYSAKYFTIRVFNQGPSVAHDVVVTDTWPFALCQYPERIQITPSGAWVTTGGDITVTLGNIAPQHSATIVVPFSVCQRSVVGIANNTASAFSPTDTSCRAASQVITVVPSQLVGKRSVHEAPTAAAAVVPLAAKAMQPVVHTAVVEAATHKPASVDLKLAPLHVGVKAVARGAKRISIEVTNTERGVPVRILEVKLSGVDAKLGTPLALDLMRVGPHVLSTTCATFAEHRLPSLWAQTCEVELSENIVYARVTVGGVGHKTDGSHAVMGSAQL
jgi:uncharacterized repeat protein (TIGR01451 family)